MRSRSHSSRHSVALGVVVLLAALWLTLVLGAQAPQPATGVNVNAGLVNPPTAHIWVGAAGTCVDNGSPLVYNAATACSTIDAGLDLADPDDVVRVQPGTYGERLSPAASGTSGHPITLVANGAVTFCGEDISSKNYIRVIGFTIDTDAGGCTKANRAIDFSGTTTGLEWWHNTIRDAIVCGICSGSATDRLNTAVVVGNHFTSIGEGTGTNGTGFSAYGDDMFLAYNEFDHIDPDQVNVAGSRIRILNNYFHDITDAADLHSDILTYFSHALGLQYLVFDGNLTVGNGGLSNEHGELVQNDGPASGTVTELLHRRNVWDRESGSALGDSNSVMGPITEIRVVHDTFVDLQRTGGPTSYALLVYGGSCSGACTNPVTLRVHNSLFYEAWSAALSSGIEVYLAQSPGALNSHDYNLSYDEGSVTFTTPFTSQAHPQSDVDPKLVDKANADFHLQGTSGAIGVAGPLTTATSCSGTTLNLAAGGGGFFRGPNTSLPQYSGLLTAGDVLTVGSTTRTVVSVSGDAVTVDTSLTCSGGDAVYWEDDPTPDIGFAPYKAGGYSLTATKSCAGGTCTITPTDAALVRMIVCYDDSVPYVVDPTSPFTCPTAAGTFQARVYPRYASSTLAVTAN